MRGPIARRAEGQQLAQRREIVLHRPVWWSHHAGGPAHDVVAGKERVLLDEVVADVVRAVAGRVDCRQRPAITLDHIPVGEALVGDKVEIRALALELVRQIVPLP